MLDESKTRKGEPSSVEGYDASDEVSVIFKDFFPDPSAFGDWQMGFRHSYIDGSRRLERAVLDDPEDLDRRVLIDICETQSFAQAKNVVEMMLKNNTQPSRYFRWGRDGSFITVTDDTAPTFSRLEIAGNLALHITSFGRSDVDVSTITDSINTRLEVDFSNSHSFEPIKIPKPLPYSRRKLRLKFSATPSLPKGGFVKFIATGGELRLKGPDLLIYTHKTGEAEIHARIIGPDGEQSPISIWME